MENKVVKSICEKHGEYESKTIKILGIEISITQCPQCVAKENLKAQKEQEAREAQYKIDREKHKIEMLYLRGVTKRYFNNKDKFTYNTDFFSLQTKDGISMLELLEVSDNGFANNHSLLICGGCGVGKSFFAYRLIELGYNNEIYYSIKTIDELTSMYRLSDFNKFSFDSIKEIIDNDDGLIIDEIDNAKNDISLKTLDLIISYCYDAEKRLILIGNGSFDTLKNAFTTKALSRIQSTFQIVNAWGLKDMRNAK